MPSTEVAIAVKPKRKSRKKIIEEDKGHVIRVPTPVYDRLTQLRSGRTYAEVLGTLLELFDRMQSEPVKYAVKDKLFDDLAEARGAAIVEAIRNHTTPDLPLIMWALAQDTGEVHGT